MDIIVVEDDVDIAELVAFNLERQSWRCRQVHHGAEGWEQIQQQHPDLVVLDVMLPGMDGMQIFRAMKENEMTRGIPAIFLTARLYAGEASIASVSPNSRVNVPRIIPIRCARMHKTLLSSSSTFFS